jgi:hypothetical protein
MKKNIYSKITLVFILSIALNFTTNAQIHKYFIITGKVISDTERIENGTIQVIKNDQSAVKVQIPEHGRFRLELDYNSDFILIFSKKDCIAKTVNVNTDIPEDVENQKSNLAHFLMAVQLSKETEHAYLMPEYQIQQIKYSPELNDFGRTSTVFDQEFVENGKIMQNQPFQVQENKSKMQISHIF